MMWKVISFPLVTLVFLLRVRFPEFCKEKGGSRLIALPPHWQSGEDCAKTYFSGNWMSKELSLGNVLLNSNKHPEKTCISVLKIKPSISFL